jgi:ribonuclease VapC
VGESYVLDTSAWLTLDEGEEGADRVEAILGEAWLGEASVWSSFVTLAELEYIRTRERSAAQAAELLTFARKQAVTWQHSSDEMCSEAAKLKASFKLSLADAFIAALAKHLGAILVHKYPELSALGGLIRQLALPPKTPSQGHTPP